MRKHHGFIAVTILCSTPAFAEEWSCSNADIAEIKCDPSSCEIERENFTAMSLGLSPSRIEICAYSGCFNGNVTIRRTAGDLVLYHATLRVGGAGERAAVILDRAAGTALMRWGSFSNVMRCNRD